MGSVIGTLNIQSAYSVRTLEAFVVVFANLDCDIPVTLGAINLFIDAITPYLFCS